MRRRARGWVWARRSSDAPTRLASSTIPTLTFPCWSGCCGSGRTAIAQPPRKVAQAFADRLNDVLNRTVTDARLTLIPIPGHDTQFSIACVEPDTKWSITSFALHGSHVRLEISHAVEVVDGREHTVSYAYRLSDGDKKDDWLIRWEHTRHPPKDSYPYPLSHVHVRGECAKLHIPTSRVPLELVLWHAIVEWDVTPKTDDWRSILEASLADFYQRRSAPAR